MKPGAFRYYHFTDVGSAALMSVTEGRPEVTSTSPKRWNDPERDLAYAAPLPGCCSPLYWPSFRRFGFFGATVVAGGTVHSNLPDHLSILGPYIVRGRDGCVCETENAPTARNRYRELAVIYMGVAKADVAISRNGGAGPT
jgi:hypothetical protein